MAMVMARHIEHVRMMPRANHDLSLRKGRSPNRHCTQQNGTILAKAKSHS